MRLPRHPRSVKYKRARQKAISYQYRYVCSAEAFWTADRIIHYQLLRWARRTHPNKC
jgi:group II intron maturase